MKTLSGPARPGTGGPDGLRRLARTLSRRVRILYRLAPSLRKHGQPTSTLRAIATAAVRIWPASLWSPVAHVPVLKVDVRDAPARGIGAGAISRAESGRQSGDRQYRVGTALAHGELLRSAPVPDRRGVPNTWCEPERAWSAIDSLNIDDIDDFRRPRALAVARRRNPGPANT